MAIQKHGVFTTFLGPAVSWPRGEMGDELLIAKLASSEQGVVMRVWLLAILFPMFGFAHAESLPSVESVLQRITTNAPLELKNDRVFRRQYRYIKTRSELESNAQGDVKKRAVTISTNLPKAELASTGDRVKAGKGSTKRDRRGGKDGGDKHSVSVDEELLSHFEFNLDQREWIRDRATLVLSFKPKAVRSAKQDLSDKFLQQIAGKVWVDESEGFITRLELELLGPVDIVGGIAGSVKSLHFTSERERTSDGHWYTRSSKGKVDTRQLFSRKIIEFSETIEDPRRVVSQAGVPAAEETVESKN